MYFSSFEEMQKAVDIVNSSPHPTNKIAATLFGTDKNNRPYSLSATNFWPDNIVEKLGIDGRIGGSSGTIHAETACILRAPYTDGARLCVTDPFCPNCAKNIAAAGIRTIYIDHKGFDKDFANRRGAAFENMSMQICERAGINVYEIRRKEQKLTPILEIPDSYAPHEEQPVIFEKECKNETDRFIFMARKKTSNIKDKNVAFALGYDEKEQLWSFYGDPQPPPGYSQQTDSELLNLRHGKYSFILEPLNRILMTAARHGMKLQPGMVYSRYAPSARELVNLIGAGHNILHVDYPEEGRDRDAITALKTLQEHNILKVYTTDI